MFWLRTVLLLTIILAFYRYVDDPFEAFLLPLVRRTRLLQGHAVSNVTAVVRMISAGTTQFMLCVSLVFLLGFDAKQLGVVRPQLVLIGYGILLGVGEMALGSLLGRSRILIAQAVAGPVSSPDIENWLKIARGGWMRFYLKTIEIVPAPFAMALLLFYVSGEEFIFRAVLLNVLLPIGTVAAVAGATAAFMIVQIFHMPSWKNAMFPLLGALLVGILHGILFVEVRDITPLITAHLIFFLSAVV